MSWTGSTSSPTSTRAAHYALTLRGRRAVRGGTQRAGWPSAAARADDIELDLP